jgi:hypothetical protein
MDLLITEHLIMFLPVIMDVVVASELIRLLKADGLHTFVRSVYVSKFAKS